MINYAGGTKGLYPYNILIHGYKKHISDNSKKIAVRQYINNKLTQKEIAKFFDIDIRTVKRWVRKYKDDCLERKKEEF